MQRIRPAAARTLTFILLLPIGGAAFALDALDPLGQRAWLRVGAFRPDIDTTARIDEASGTALGTQFSFEYFQLRRSGRATLAETLTVDDTTYPVAAELDSRFQSDVYRLGIGYSIVRAPHLELGAMVGLHVTEFDVRLQGTVSTPGQPISTAIEQERQTVPLPTIGLYGAFAFAPGWQATLRADYFSLKHGDYDGRLINAQMNLVYRVAPNVGLGLGWRTDDYRIDSTKAAFRGRVEYRFQGPQAFVEAVF